MTPTQRYSRQREAVLEAVRHSAKHPTAEMVYEQVRQEIPSISLGTVYRNLGVLTESGKIREFVLEDHVKRYDGNLSRHLHCICTSCGKIQDVEIDIHRSLQQIAVQICDFQIEEHRIELYGLCSQCSQTMEQTDAN